MRSDVLLLVRFRCGIFVFVHEADILWAWHRSRTCVLGFGLVGRHRLSVAGSSVVVQRYGLSAVSVSGAGT